MKKILALLLALIMCSFTFIGCDNAEDELGGYIGNYPETDEQIEKLTLNLYIITDDRTSDFAVTTVKRMVTQYTEQKFKTELIVHYLKESEYDAKVLTAVTSNDKNSANIVLVNSPELMTQLVNTKKLADLTVFLDDNDYKQYHSLNGSIPKPLLAGSKIGKNLYSIPNNHPIGEYKYLVINKEMARDILKFSPEKLTSYKTLEDASELTEKISEYGKNPEDYVYYVSGNYGLRAEYEAEGNYCNVSVYPTVDENEAFSSAFAIVNKGQKYVERSMQIIYAINNDAYLRNLLQYGVEGTNYVVQNGDIKRVSSGENVYYMNINYTGDVFLAEYCSEIGWDKVSEENANNQNNQAVLK